MAQTGLVHLTLVQVFLLMPLRHTPTVERLREVMERVASLTDTHAAHAQLLDKFRRQTLRRLQVRMLRNTHLTPACFTL